MEAGARMKLRMVAVAAIVALVLIYSVASIVTAESDEDTGPENTIFENPGDVDKEGDFEVNPTGGDDVGGPNPPC